MWDGDLVRLIRRVRVREVPEDGLPMTQDSGSEYVVMHTYPCRRYVVVRDPCGSLFVVRCTDLTVVASAAIHAAGIDTAASARRVLTAARQVTAAVTPTCPLALPGG